MRDRQQIVISGIGGQGVLFVTRILAEAAIEQGLEVLTSETHGMAMRGGTVISHVKVGPFSSPLIRQGQADCGLFLHAGNLEVHQGFLKPEGRIFLNGQGKGEGIATIDATALASAQGSLVIANLVLLGFAVKQGGLFCDAATVEKVLQRISPARQLGLNLEGFRLGMAASPRGASAGLSSPASVGPLRQTKHKETGRLRHASRSGLFKGGNR